LAAVLVSRKMQALADICLFLV